MGEEIRLVLGSRGDPGRYPVVLRVVSWSVSPVVPCHSQSVASPPE